jgi:hypothetical protein
MSSDGERSAISKVKLLGRSVMLGADLVASEHNRRITSGIGSITNRALLRVLFDMPENRHYDWSWFDPVARRELLAASEGIVERTATGVSRLACYPIERLGVVLTGTDSRSLLNAAGDFAPFAQRWICCPTDNDPEIELEASLYRIGVMRINRDGESVETCEPPPFIPERFTPTLWHFHELAYSALLAANAFQVTVPTS